jgi:hypothetical protein
MNSIIDIVPELLNRTRNNNIDWDDTNTPCYYTSYNNHKLVICRVPTANGKIAISLNYLDDNYYIIGSPNKWENDQPDYSVVNELYDEVANKKVAHA